MEDEIANSYLSKIDTVLDYIKKMHPAPFDHQHVYWSLKKEINDAELSTILNTLSEDSHIIKHPSGQYSLTFNGALFPGYAVSIADAKRDREISRNNLEIQQKLQVKLDEKSGTLNRLTTWVTIGTISMAILQLISLIADHDVRQFFGY